jgi:hypothetical protein
MHSLPGQVIAAGYLVEIAAAAVHDVPFPRLSRSVTGRTIDLLFNLPGRLDDSQKSVVFGSHVAILMNILFV